MEITNLKSKDILSVYSGKAGACCCGCSGKHYYNSSLREIAGDLRGYSVTDDEVNDKQVERILALIQGIFIEDPDAVVVGGTEHVFSITIGKRQYIAYSLVS